MARNGESGDGHRGAVDDRSQFKHPNGHWIKRDAETGKIRDVKSNGRPYKGDYSEIAYELGFKYPQHFTRVLKQHVG